MSISTGLDSWTAASPPLARSKLRLDTVRIGDSELNHPQRKPPGLPDQNNVLAMRCCIARDNETICPRNVLFGPRYN